MPSLVWLGFHKLSFCLFVMLLNVSVYAHDFAKKALEYRSNFDAVG